LNITPGNDMIYVFSRSISQGSTAGYYSAIGIFVGCFVHIAAAIFGLSAIMAGDPFLFELIKYAGAAYLFYIGIRMILIKSPAGGSIKKLTVQSNLHLLKQGITTSALNPKVALFFLSFLPQFVDPASSYIKLHLLFLGIWFAVQGTLVLLLVAFLLGRTTNFIKQHPRFWIWQERTAGLMMIMLGIKLALTSKK
jgi:threonine/homoserine/homoserine lactone efflux protein